MSAELTIRQQLGAAAAWVLVTAACLWFSNNFQMSILVWWPNGIAVAAMIMIPSRKWPLFLSLALVGGLPMSLMLGYAPLHAMGLILANLVDAAIAAALAQRVLERGNQTSLSTSEMYRLIGSAALGAGAGAFLAQALQSNGLTVSYSAWWFSSAFLGTLVGAPLFLVMIGKLGSMVSGSLAYANQRTNELAPAALGVFLISTWVLSYEEMSLLFIPMSMTIFAVTRYSQIGATVCVAAFCLAASFQSFGGSSPAAFLDLNFISSGIVLQFFMMLVLATSVPLAALIMSHQQMAAKLQTQNRDLRKNLALFSMAENVAGMGRWTQDLRTGRQEWSPEMRRINGFGPEEDIDPDMALSLLPDGGKVLVEQLTAHRYVREPYAVDFTICRLDGEERDLHMRLTNEFDDTGRLIQRFGVVLDVTDQRRREKALAEARTRAMQLAAEAQILANTDALTGLASRRSLMRQLQKCVRGSEDSGRHLSIVAFDVDHFKLVNDQFGHMVGDEVLVRVARIAREQARSRDLVGRTGGEEFVWLMPGTPVSLAEQAAERLRAAIEDRTGSDGCPKVTASIGVAEWSAGWTADELLAAADEALYTAKNAGRNQVKVAA